jgi:hypothetical protein
MENEVAELPASEPEVTATPEPVETPEVVVAKTFTQEELDAAIGKRLAREQRKWEREQAQRVVTPPAAVAPPPIPESYDTTEAYAEALATRKAEEMVQRREESQRQSAIIEAYHDREEEARGKYDDFEQVAYNPQVRITDVMAETIRASEMGPDLAYHLGANPKEADRISRLAPFVQAKEIGKLEAKLASDPPVKKTSNAPAPIAPVTARSVGSPAYDTTDPRSVKTMSTSEWIEADRKRQIKKLEAQRLR